jgi:hypothetical protein
MKNRSTNVPVGSDATWLTECRSKYRLCQSDIAAVLGIMLKRPINQGRIAEIETGQRCLIPEWRAALIRFFNRIEEHKAQGKDWRDGLFS